GTSTDSPSRACTRPGAAPPGSARAATSAGPRSATAASTGAARASPRPRTENVVSRHMSEGDSIILEATRRRLTEKQADTVDKLTKAAVEVLAREGFAGMTIRMVAAAAGVGTATAYTYFSSKEHLVAEIFWRRLAASPSPVSEDPDPKVRVVAELRNIAMLVADEQQVSGAVTSALLGRDPDVAHLRGRIGGEIRK